MPVPAASLPGVFRTGTHGARPAVGDVAPGTLYACTTHFIIYQSDGSTWNDYIALPVSQTSAIPVVIGDGSTTMLTGLKGSIEIPFPCIISANRLVADVSGSIVVDVKKAAYSGVPTFASICASAKPTLSSAQKSEDSTLTGWTTSLAAGDWLQFNVDSVSTIKLVTLSLTVTRL